MLKFLLLVVLVMLALAVAGVVVLYQVLGWWALPVILVGFVVLLAVAKLVFFKLIETLFRMPFKAKGAALRDAKVTLHSVEPCAAPNPPADEPAEDDEQAKEEAARRWYALDVTIEPKPHGGAFQHWEPGELILIKPDAKPGADPEDLGTTNRVELWRDGQFVNDEDCKYTGTQRVRIQMSLPPDIRKARLGYYFEILDPVIDFPAVALTVAAPQ